MHAAGLKAFEARDEKRTGVYSFEKRPESFPAALEAKFRQNKAAWKFFNEMPPGKRRTSLWWVISAAREETRLKRLAKLIDLSSRGKRLELVD